MWYLHVSPPPSVYMGQHFTSIMEPLVIFFCQIFSSFCGWNKEHFVFEHLRKMLQPNRGIFLLPQKWCIDYANFCIYLCFWKAHFVHFQMRYSSLHSCKYLLRYKIKQLIGTISPCNVAQLPRFIVDITPRVRQVHSTPRVYTDVYTGIPNSAKKESSFLCHLSQNLCKMFPVLEIPLFKGLFTVRLLKPRPPRQWKTIRWQNWNNRFQSSQSKVLFSNPANQMSGRKQWNLDLFIEMLKRLRCRLSIKCQAQTVNTFACLNWIICRTTWSPSLGACNFHTKSMPRHFYRPVYF